MKNNLLFYVAFPLLSILSCGKERLHFYFAFFSGVCRSFFWSMLIALRFHKATYSLINVPYFIVCSGDPQHMTVMEPCPLQLSFCNIFLWTKGLLWAQFCQNPEVPVFGKTVKKCSHMIVGHYNQMQPCCWTPKVQVCDCRENIPEHHNFESGSEGKPVITWSGC